MPGFACTDIRYRKKADEEGPSVKKPLSEKEAISADKKEMKRLVRKRKKQGKLSKEENIALDCLYNKRRDCKKKFVKEMPEDIDEVSTAKKNLIHDGFDDQFIYKSVEPFVVKSGGVLNYLEFNFEENITISIVEDPKIGPHDDFDYNQVPPVYKTDGVIDYYAPLEDLILGYIFWFYLIFYTLQIFPLIEILILNQMTSVGLVLTSPSQSSHVPMTILKLRLRIRLRRNLSKRRRNLKKSSRSRPSLKLLQNPMK